MATPATDRGFANGFFLGHLWDVLPWLWSSRRTASFRQVARRGGVVGLCWKATDARAGLTKSSALRLHVAESCGLFAEVLPIGPQGDRHRWVQNSSSSKVLRSRAQPKNIATNFTVGGYKALPGTYICIRKICNYLYDNWLRYFG